MDYESFVLRVNKYPVFGEEVLGSLEGSKALKQLQLNRWSQSDKVIRLKRGLYTLPDDRRRVPLSQPWLANTLYSPSYISLEYMLSRYDMIPERVTVVTSITSLKTASYENLLGHFIYRNLKKDLFFGFEEEKDECGYPVLMATPEKAILDYIYLYSGWQPTWDFMETNLRFQQLDQLNKKRLKQFSKKFKMKKIHETVKLLLEVAT